MKNRSLHLLAGGLLMAAARLALGAHPLITDDAGTQGTGNNQVELNSDWARSQGATTRAAAFAYTYGVAPALDAFASLPYSASSPTGISDVSLGAKWRFRESEGTSYALKGELLLPSGDADKGLGNGKAGAALALLVSHDMERWSFHGNLGLTANRYKLAADRQANRSTVWRASAAAVYEATEQVHLVTDIGAARNTDRSDATYPSYFLVGAIYSPRPDLDLDIGLKLGLNHAEAHRQAGVGLTFRF